MQANLTTETTITQAQAHTTTTNGPTWITKQPATRPYQPRRPATRWTAEDAAYHAEAYKAWLQGIDSDRWQEIYGQHTPAEFAHALHDCRYCKNAQQQYDTAGKPARWTARLEEVRQQMRATLKALHFENPKALWQEYQWSQYRDPNGYSPDHAAHIASVDHYLWLGETSRAIALDAIDGGYTSPYQCNIDSALEESRPKAAPEYAAGSPDPHATQEEYYRLHALADAEMRQARYAVRAYIQTGRPAAWQSAARRLVQAIQFDQEAAEANLQAQTWWQDREFSLERSAPAAPGTKTVDIYDRAAETHDAIQNLLDLQQQSRDLIAYVESRKAAGKELTTTQERMYAEAQDLLPVIAASIAAQTARIQA